MVPILRDLVSNHYQSKTRKVVLTVFIILCMYICTCTMHSANVVTSPDFDHSISLAHVVSTIAQRTSEILLSTCHSQTEIVQSAFSQTF